MSTNDLRPPRDYRLPVPPGRSTFDLVLGGIRVRVADLPAVVKRVEADLSPLALSTDRTDGLSLDFGDWRMNLRASNTARSCSFSHSKVSWRTLAKSLPKRS